MVEYNRNTLEQSCINSGSLEDIIDILSLAMDMFRQPCHGAFLSLEFFSYFLTNMHMSNDMNIKSVGSCLYSGIAKRPLVYKNTHAAYAARAFTFFETSSNFWRILSIARKANAFD